MSVWPLVFIVFTAFSVEATLGFGATMVTVGLGALFYPLDLLLPAFVPLNIVLSLTIAFVDRRTIDWRLLLRRILPWMGLGMPGGILLYQFGSDRLLYVGCGVFVIVISFLELWRMFRRGPVRTRPLGAVAEAAVLVAGGVVHGAYAGGGPMVVYVVGRAITDKRAFRSTLCALWFVLNVVLVVSYAVAGDITARTAELCLYLAAPVAAGIAAGQWLHTRIDEKLFKALVFGLLLAAGVVLLGRG